MRNIRSLVLGLVLVSLAGVSWGEEDVWYCVQEHRVGLEPVFADWLAPYEVKPLKKRKFTLKYEADANRLAIKGRQFAGDGNSYMECTACSPGGAYEALDTILRFHMLTDGEPEGRFIFTKNALGTGEMSTGTCTKF